jgi:hypothetical protein
MVGWWERAPGACQDYLSFILRLLCCRRYRSTRPCTQLSEMKHELAVSRAQADKLRAELAGAAAARDAAQERAAGLRSEVEQLQFLVDEVAAAHAADASPGKAGRVSCWVWERDGGGQGGAQQGEAVAFALAPPHHAVGHPPPAATLPACACSWRRQPRQLPRSQPARR